MNKVIVRIAGNEYTIEGDEKKDYILKVAAHVDEMMEKTMTGNPRLSTNMAAVLTAINIADQYFKENSKLSEIEGNLNQPLKELKDVSATLGEMRAKIEEKDRTISNLEAEVSNNMEIIEALQKEQEVLKNMLKEKEDKLREAEEISTEFQNRMYDLQIKLVELENEKIGGNKE